MMLIVVLGLMLDRLACAFAPSVRDLIYLHSACGLFGGVYPALAAGFAMMADLTHTGSRTLYFGVLEGELFLSRAASDPPQTAVVRRFHRLRQNVSGCLAYNSLTMGVHSHALLGLGPDLKGSCLPPSLLAQWSVEYWRATSAPIWLTSSALDCLEALG